MAVKRHTTSPAGERIEIVSDDDWVKQANGKTNRGGKSVTDRSVRMWHGGMKRYVIADLWRNGPVIDPQSGRAATVLWDRIRESFGDDAIVGEPQSFSTLVRDPLNTAAFETDTRAKRTYSINLIALPQLWYDKLMADEAEREKERRRAEQERERQERFAAELEAAEREAVEAEQRIGLGEPVATDSMNGDQPDDTGEFERMVLDMQLDAPTEYDMGPPLDISIASQVAMSLLTTVVEIISAGSGAAVDEKVRKLQGDLNDVMTKLSQRLEDNDRMRRQLRQAGDDINALRLERDGLRSRLRATEANLTAALKGDAVQAINGEIQRRVDAIMRVSPKGKGDE